MNKTAEFETTNLRNKSMQSQLPECRREAPKNIDADWSQVSSQTIELLRSAVREKRYPILLHGPTGTGKTSLAACLYRSLGHTPKWFETIEFIRWIQQCRKEGITMLPGAAQEVPEAKIWESRIERPDFIMFDDLGHRTATDSQYEIIYELLNRRGKKPAVYSSNLSPAGILKIFDDRVASRLSAGTVIHLTGNDARLTGSKRYETKGFSPD